MPPRTNSEKIDDLTQKVLTTGAIVEEQKTAFREYRELFRSELDALWLDMRRISERLAAVEQRCANLEKHGDRNWAIWLAVLALVPGVLSLVLTLNR